MRRAYLLLVALAACAGAPARPEPSPTITLSVVGTNDIHGHVAPEADGTGGLALLGGYVANLRRARAGDGGGVLLVDAGDMFQGTLESNPNEGAAVVAAMNVLGYDAAAVGNHEFDFGPAGPLVVPRSPTDDARGALRARAAEARFPFLTANVLDAATGKVFEGKNFAPSVMKEVAGVKVGIVGVTTADTPRTTIAPNFAGLAIKPLHEAIDDETRKLRAAGAEVIVVAAHSGLCQRVAAEEVLQDCDFGEILDAVNALSEPIDVVIAGHTHAGVTRQVGRVAISEAWKYAHGFGRVDVVFDRVRREVVRTDIHPPRKIVPGDTYEGAAVAPDAEVAAVIAPFVAAAARQREEPLGVRIEEQVDFGYDKESELGNLFADLMRQARPQADVAIGNGGALRNDLPAGDLTYGELFLAFPFDNRFALVKLTGADLRGMLTANLRSPKGILNTSGVRVVATCRGAELEVKLLRDDGREIRDGDKLVLATSEFLVGSGMEGAMGSLAQREVKIEESGSIRDELAAMLRKRGGVLRGDDPTIYDPASPRMKYPGARPVSCPRT